MCYTSLLHCTSPTQNTSFTDYTSPSLPSRCGSLATPFIFSPLPFVWANLLVRLATLLGWTLHLLALPETTIRTNILDTAWCCSSYYLPPAFHRLYVCLFIPPQVPIPVNSFQPPMAKPSSTPMCNLWAPMLFSLTLPTELIYRAPMLSY